MPTVADTQLPTTLRLRRAPQQERARRRVAGLLDAADRVLAQEGAAALTTTRIAAEAGVSVGALYQWFGDLDAIVEALALRYVDEFKALGRALADAPPTGDPGARVLDAFADAFRTRPAFRALWFGGLRTEHLRDLTRPGLGDLAASLRRILAAEAPGADPARLAPVADMAVRLVDALLRQAFRDDPAGDPGLLAETRTLLRSYLHDQLDTTPRKGDAP